MHNAHTTRFIPLKCPSSGSLQLHILDMYFACLGRAHSHYLRPRKIKKLTRAETNVINLTTGRMRALLMLYPKN